jgi:hypothetical protein
MAKRYHENRSMERASALKHGMDPRRRQEMEDAGMIREDHSAVANLPQMVKYHDWPANDDYPRYGLDDTIKGIDKQEREDYKEMEKHKQRGKY